jgi:predicted Zn-dependent peptidase
MKRREWMKLAAAAALSSRWGLADEIVSHPTQLKFPALAYEPPKAAEHRHELPHGAVAFLVEDHQLPLIDISLLIRTGDYLVPKEQAGLASFTGEQIRAGGTMTMSARDFDEEAAFLATDISSVISDTSGRAGMGCLTQNLSASLKLFFDMLKNPGFDPDRLDLAKTRSLQAMERRNDRVAAVLRREFARLMYGDEHFSTWESTKASVEAVTPERMKEFHQRYYHPSAFVFAVSGDFDRKEMLDRLGEALSDGWPGLKSAVPKVPAPAHEPAAGVYMVNKREVNQSSIRLGHLGIQRDNPDRSALGIMNEILGGGGFTSRIMSRVRSDEGLAYSAGSGMAPGTYYRGTFSAGFESKNPSCAQATAIVLEEIARVREEKVSDWELEAAKNYSIEIFPRFFATASSVAGTFADDEYTGREKDYWEKYRERIAAVTTGDVLRVAQQYLQPSRVAILAVGNVEEILRGNPDRPQYQFNKFTPDGKIQRIPLPDPLTMRYPEG